MESTAKKSKNLRRLIVILSVVIPLVVAVLFKVKIEGVDLTFLPPIYAGINGVTAVLLLIALLFIKQKKVKLHERVIRICLFLSLLFLASYVAYHMTSDSAIYGGSLGMLYYPLLISHIVLSIAVVPLVLYSFLLGLEGQFEKHRKWTKFTWPIWFYVAVSGVIVYFMISPYYA